jgi:hypothetical protein
MIRQQLTGVQGLEQFEEKQETLRQIRQQLRREQQFEQFEQLPYNWTQLPRHQLLKHLERVQRQLARFPSFEQQQFEQNWTQMPTQQLIKFLERQNQLLEQQYVQMPYGYTQMPRQHQQLLNKLRQEQEFEQLVDAEELLNNTNTTGLRRGVRCCELLEAEIQEERLRRQVRHEEQKKKFITELIRQYHLGQIVNKEELTQQMHHVEKQLTKQWQMQEEECMLLEKQIMEQHRINKMLHHQKQHQQQFFPVNPIKQFLTGEEKQQQQQLIRGEQRPVEQQLRRQLYQTQEREIEQGRLRHEQLRRQVNQIEREIREICQQQQLEKLMF